MTSATLPDYQQAAGARSGQYDGHELAADYGDSQAEYAATQSGAALMALTHAGRVWMTDRDRAALLHRLSTNEIEQLQPGQGTQTVVTNHNGRIIDLLTVHAFPERLLLVTSPFQGPALLTLLRRNIFFNDKVKLEDASASLGQLALYGPQSRPLLQGLAGSDLGDLALYQTTELAINGVTTTVARIKPIGGAGFVLYAPAEQMGDLWAALIGGGAQPLGQTAYDIARVEAGYPAYGRELSLDYIPLETGLWDAVSFKKGCYVGQEIIARMESRNRIAKLLRGLHLSGPVETPTKLVAGGKEAGDLTSVVHSPRYGWIGLAYVRSAHAAGGTQVGFANSDVSGEVIELPFCADH